ncbi:hypothetical protein E1200_19015 [Actinomadura sp. GC306]|uniref:DUF5954 family protein n=1 Tax=Actinomadura sp. GC306 TaxID=2530367 RepID=UPI001052DF3A|nr:DUF5954 family protein [Actinomadura sp. GC306]TDC65112.1 hypothetical protein E1200_19015 [Actinomadura sp. GC306]
MSFEGMPGHDVINVGRDLEPVAAVRDQEAAERRRAYPGLVPAGPPEFGCAGQAGGAWRILALGAATPAAARAGLAAHLRGLATGHDAAAGKELLLLADALETAGEAGGPLRTECAAGPLRFRVVRVPGFARFGADGPEPARVTDAEDGRPDPRIDPAAPVGPADAALRLELLGLPPEAGPVPEARRREAAAAAGAHLGVVLLPPYFAVMEDRDGQWRPVLRAAGPQGARDALARHFRLCMRREAPEGGAPPSPGELAEYARAADRIDAAGTGAHGIGAHGGVEFAACGRLFRIVRVVRALRVGPDGPEPARPSDEGA